MTQKNGLISEVGKISCWLLLGLVVLGALGYAGEAVLVRHSRKDVIKVSGYLELEWVRTWGGDQQKLFFLPCRLKVGPEDRVYIAGRHAHSIRVFDMSGKYFRSIGWKGPNQLNHISDFDFQFNGDLVVMDQLGYRMRKYIRNARSMYLFKLPSITRRMMVDSQANFYFMESRKAVAGAFIVKVRDKKGQVSGYVGKHLYDFSNIQGHAFPDMAMDGLDKIYIMDAYAPVVRKYSPAGKLLRAITFEPLGGSSKVVLNEAADEIRWINKGSGKDMANIVEVIKGVRGRFRPVKDAALGMFTVDQKGWIYLVSAMYSVDEAISNKGSQKGSNRGSNAGSGVVMDGHSLEDKNDKNALWVFNKKGEIVAQTVIAKSCSSIYVDKNRLFIMGTASNKTIWQYRMKFIEAESNKKEPKVKWKGKLIDW